MATHIIHKDAGATSARNIAVSMRSSTSGQLTTVARTAVTARYTPNTTGVSLPITLVDKTAGTYTDSGWVVATDETGVHDFSVPAAVLAVSGATEVKITFKATGMLDASETILLAGNAGSTAAVNPSGVIDGASTLATAANLTTAQADLTTLTGRLTATRAGYLDAAITSRSTLDGTGVQSALTSQGFTTTVAGRIDAAISSRSTLDGAGVQSAMTTQGFSTTLAANIGTTNTRIDAAVTSRMATFTYTAPPTVNDIQSGLATTAGLSASSAGIISALPSVSGLATTAQLSASSGGIITAIPSISGLATTSQLSASSAGIISALPSVAGLATAANVTSGTNTITDAIAGIVIELSPEAIATIAEDVAAALAETGIPTEENIAAAVKEALLSTTNNEILQRAITTFVRAIHKQLSI